MEDMGSSLRHDIRNLAIIAHVDHGKTTLVDALLKQSHTFRDNQDMGTLIMDSNDQERERGITILAKNTAISYNGTIVNIIDTPGHADFGGEVERVLNMAEGCLLLIDAAEGPMPQTRFVLRKAFEAGLKVILVINKLDRPNADVAKALHLAEELFLELAHTDAQLDIPVIYAIGREGVAGLKPDQLGGDMTALFEAIIEHIPCPVVEEGNFQMLVANRAYDDYTGALAIGRINRGSIRAGEAVSVMGSSDNIRKAKVMGVMLYKGLKMEAVDEAHAGDIVVLSGLEKISIGDTVADALDPTALPRIDIEEPTVQMTFGVNTSPLSGKEGKYSTSRMLRERLWSELETNLGLRVAETGNADKFLVSGRGELHLAVLIETMRREGYEFEVSRPKVIFKNVNGVKSEPVEHVTVEVQEPFLGAVAEALGRRRGEMIEIAYGKGAVRVDYKMPTRGLIGFRNTFLTITGGTGIMGSILLGYRPYAGEFSDNRNGALTASAAGVVLAFGLAAAQERGATFVEPGTQVYEGMIVGLQKRPGDMAVNVTRAKQLTNMRASTSDIGVRLTPATILSLEQAMDFLGDDELLEVTPQHIRLRKRHLTEVDASRARREDKVAQQA
jgi:GTP-binding protein